MDGFATEAPVGADLKSGKLAPSEQAIDGRGMQLHRGPNRVEPLESEGRCRLVQYLRTRSFPWA